MKVFISNVDSPIGYNLSRLFSKSSPGATKKSESDNIDDTPDEESKAAPQLYSVIGTLTKNPAEIISKPGELHYSGNKTKDDDRRECIEKFAVPGVKPKWVESVIDVRIFDIFFLSN